MRKRTLRKLHLIRETVQQLDQAHGGERGIGGNRYQGPSYNVTDCSDCPQCPHNCSCLGPCGTQYPCA